jgi:hypothetical protein
MIGRAGARSKLPGRTFGHTFDRVPDLDSDRRRKAGWSAWVQLVSPAWFQILVTGTIRSGEADQPGPPQGVPHAMGPTHFRREGPILSALDTAGKSYIPWNCADCAPESTGRSRCTAARRKVAVAFQPGAGAANRRGRKLRPLFARESPSSPSDPRRVRAPPLFVRSVSAPTPRTAWIDRRRSSCPESSDFVGDATLRLATRWVRAGRDREITPPGEAIPTFFLFFHKSKWNKVLCSADLSELEAVSNWLRDRSLGSRVGFPVRLPDTSSL